MNSSKLLFIQIPCLNEENDIGDVIKSIPKNELEKLGLKVKILVIDDGSVDKTSEIANGMGCDFILRHKKTLGLARSFADGLEFCLNRRADIIVNTDGDNQYNQSEIPKIVEPIIKDKADMVIGDRQIEKLQFMPGGKKIGNQIGSFILEFLTGLSIPDASSGFRAISGELARKFNLQSAHTYTHETIIQAANLSATILYIPIVFKRRRSGDSRLIGGVVDHIKKSTATIIRAVLTYKAFKYLLTIGLVIILIGFLGVLRFLYFFVIGDGRGHIQSLIISSAVINLGFIIIVLGVIADLISVNRKLLEEIKSKLKSSKS